MKKILLATILTFSSSCFACSFKVSDSPGIRNVVKQNGGYPVSDEQCMFLNKRGLAISISGHATVLGGISIAWADVRLMKLKMGIVSDSSQYSTQLDTGRASQDVADSMLYKAIGIAIDRLDYVSAADQVDAYLAKRK